MDQNLEMKKGPWAKDEDRILKNYIDKHGIGRWDSLACKSGLKRSGNSCRLRWFNHLSPNIRRGSITDKEMLLILKLHSELGSKWSKIAKHEQLRGRTDNEIKNFWNTRIKREATQLNCDVNSMEFLQIMSKRLMESIQAAEGACGISGGSTGTAVAPSLTTTSDHALIELPPLAAASGSSSTPSTAVASYFTTVADQAYIDAYVASLFSSVIGANGGTAATAMFPSVMATADYANIIYAASATPSYSFTSTTTTTSSNYAYIDAAIATPSYSFTTTTTDHANTGAEVASPSYSYTTTTDQAMIGVAFASPSHNLQNLGYTW